MESNKRAARSSRKFENLHHTTSSRTWNRWERFHTVFLTDFCVLFKFVFSTAFMEGDLSREDHGIYFFFCHYGMLKIVLLQYIFITNVL